MVTQARQLVHVQVKSQYSVEINFTDRARWDSCKWLRLKHHAYRSDLKEMMERFIQNIRDRTECFDDSFPRTKRILIDYMCIMG